MANIPNTYTTPTALLEALQQVLPPSYFSTVDGKPRLLIDHLTTSLTPEHSQVNYGLRWQRQPEQCERDSIGKQAVLAYKPEWTVGTPVPNKPPHILIRGDNYYALKALKHTHRSAIDVIYIDPPYNTGNKDFVYNDNFVDAEDGFKHSKWLSFMERRLKLAKELLAPGGVIFISIDDNEQSTLTLLCDHIFGESNRVGPFIKKTAGGKSDSGFCKTNHEYLLAYGDIRYLLKEESQGSADSQPLRKWGDNDRKSDRPNLHYPLYLCPSSGKIDTEPFAQSVEFFPTKSDGSEGCWRWSSSKVKKDLARLFIKTKKDGSFDVHVAGDPTAMKNSPWSSVVDTFTGPGGTFLKAMFGEADTFTYPKNPDFIKWVIARHRNSSAVVLDFFAGSGTTAQAVIELNNEDGGSRQCIVATNDEGEFKDAAGAPLPGGICTNVTHPRISKVLTGYTNASGKEVPGLPGQLHAFDATLADPLPTPCAYDQAAEMLKNYGIGWAISKGFSHVVSSTDNHIECATTAGNRLYIIRMQGSFKKIQAHLKSIPFAESDSLMAAVSPLWPKEHYHMDLPPLQAKNLITPPCSAL